MVREEIVTALQNSIDRGETLEDAKKILIFSGYNANDVEQASHYIKGSLDLIPKPDEELVLKESNKRLFSKSIICCRLAFQSK